MIVQIIRSLEVGGLERLALDLAAALKAAGNDVSLYSIYKHEPALQTEAERLRIPVVQFDKLDGFSVSVLRRIAFQLRKDHASVVHTHNELVHPYGAIAARLAGVPVVVNTIHGKKGLVDTRLSRNFRYLLPWTDAVVCVSAETATQFGVERERYPKMFRIIRNGIPTSHFSFTLAKPGSCWPGIRIGTVARLAEVKDQSTLIRAFGLIRDQFPHAELRLLGDGPLRKHLEAVSAGLGLSEFVRFEGANANVAEFLRTLDVFVLSSLSEGLPLAILEAMAAGLPIVSTRVGGIPEVAPEHLVAEYCQPNDPSGLAAALFRVLKPDRLIDMGRAAQEIAEQLFSIDLMAKCYGELYQELLLRNRYPALSLVPRFH